MVKHILACTYQFLNVPNSELNDAFGREIGITGHHRHTKN